MKKSKECPKCQSLRIGYVERLPDRDGDAQGVGRYDATPQSNFRTTWVTHEIEGYLCTDCGYLETYVRSPRSVPYQKIPGFRWVNPDVPDEGPFR